MTTPTIQDELRAAIDGWSGDSFCVSDDVATRAADRIDRLEKALAPFAKAYDRFTKTFPLKRHENRLRLIVVTPTPESNHDFTLEALLHASTALNPASDK